MPKELNIKSTTLVLIDFQEKLFPAMHDKDKLLRNVVKLVQGAKVLEIPIILTEQYPKGLGSTIPEIKSLIPDIKPIEKVCFNCCDEDQFCTALDGLKRKQLLIAGIEAHICIYQTALALVQAGYEVQVVGDCVASREPENKVTALSRLVSEGVILTTMEMALFELLKEAKGDKFKQISSIVK
jgi:nicotinamidase-related amidase